MTDKEVFDIIDNLIRAKCIGKFYSDYYVGITDSIERRVFNEHKVSETCHWFRECSSKEIAGKVEKLFLAKGMIGSTGGGNEDSRHVYVYRITETTKEAPKFVDIEEIIEEGKSKPTVQLYPCTHQLGNRIWKIRLIGKEQVGNYHMDDKKHEAMLIAEKYAKEKDAIYEEAQLIGKI